MMAIMIAKNVMVVIIRIDAVDNAKTESVIAIMGMLIIVVY